MPHLSFELDGPLAIFTLTNPPQNRITHQMSDELEAALVSIEASGARAVLVRAEGPDFCFGGDITNWPDLTEQELRAMFEHHLKVFNAFEALPIPTIASVQGLCFGGGLELAVRADILIAGETARFGHPEQTLAVVTLLGGVYRVAAKAGRAKAMEWALTSEQISAPEMERHGVVNRVVPDSLLIAESLEFARRIANGPTRAHATHKALLNAWTAGGIGSADEVVIDLTLELFGSEDVRMAIPAAIKAARAGEKRPNFDFKGR